MLQPHLDTSTNIARSIVKNLNTVEESDNQLFTRVAARLVKDHNFEMKEAQYAASVAIAENDSLHCNGHFDLDHSTSKCVFVQIDGVTRVLSLSKVLRDLDY